MLDTPMEYSRTAPLGISAHKYTFNLPISQILLRFFLFFHCVSRFDAAV